MYEDRTDELRGIALDEAERFYKELCSFIDAAKEFHTEWDWMLRDLKYEIGPTYRADFDATMDKLFKISKERIAQASGLL